MNRADKEHHDWFGGDLVIHIETSVGVVNPTLRLSRKVGEFEPTLHLEICERDLVNLESAVATLRSIKDAKREKDTT